MIRAALSDPNDPGSESGAGVVLLDAVRAALRVPFVDPVSLDTLGPSTRLGTGMSGFFTLSRRAARALERELLCDRANG